MQEQHELLLERARLHAGQHENGSYEQYGHSNGHGHAGPSGEDAEEDPILLHVLEAASRWEAVARGESRGGRRRSKRGGQTSKSLLHGLREDIARAREVESEAEQRHAEEREARLLGRMAAGASAEEESSDSEKEEETVHSLLLLLETLAHRSKKYARDELAWHEQHAQRQLHLHFETGDHGHHHHGRHHHRAKQTELHALRRQADEALNTVDLRRARAAHIERFEDNGLMEVLVCYGGGDEDDMNESLRVHLAPDTTCAEVVARAARYWELHPEDFYLCRGDGAVWTRTACAVDVLIQYDDEPEVTPEVLLKPRPKIAKPAHSFTEDAATEAMDDDLSLEATLRELLMSQLRALSDLFEFTHDRMKHTVTWVQRYLPERHKRSTLAAGLLQTIILTLIIVAQFIAADVSADSPTTYRLCAHVVNNARPLRTKDIDDVRSWLRDELPSGLFRSAVRSRLSQDWPRWMGVGQSVLLGGVRLHQLRVAPQQPCPAGSFWWNDTSTNASSYWNETDAPCLPSYRTAYRSTAPYGFATAALSAELRSAFAFREVAELEGGGLLSIPHWNPPYDRAGYAVTLSGNLTHDELASATAALVANGWVDRQTRVIILDAGAYNPALGVAVAVQVAVEVTAAGRVREQHQCSALDSGTQASFALNVATLIYVVLTMATLCLGKAYRSCKRRFAPPPVPEADNTRLLNLGRSQQEVELHRRLARERAEEETHRARPALLSVSDALHFGALIAMLAACVLQSAGIVQHNFLGFNDDCAIIMQPEVGVTAEGIMINESSCDMGWPTPHMRLFTPFAHYALLAHSLLGVAMLLCVCRFAFYYSFFSSTLFLLRRALARAALPFVATLLILLIFLAAFAMVGNNIFGAADEQFASIGQSLLTLVATLIRIPAFDPARSQQPAHWVQDSWLETAPVLNFFWLPHLYLVLLAVAFRSVIVGLFRAILIAAYAEVNDTHVPPTDLAASDDRHNLFPTIGERRERARAAFTPH